MKFSRLAIGQKFKRWDGECIKTGYYTYSYVGSDKVESIDLDIATPRIRLGDVYTSPLGGEVVVVAVGDEYIGILSNKGPLLLTVESFLHTYKEDEIES